jgi:hypothetical protein
LLDEHARLNISTGPLLRNKMGLMIRAIDFEPQFFDRLEWIQLFRPDLIPSTDNISEEYGIYRSFRQGFTSEATNKGLPSEVIDANNHWRKFHKAGASRSSLSM